MRIPLKIFWRGISIYIHYYLILQLPYIYALQIMLDNHVMCMGMTVAMHAFRCCLIGSKASSMHNYDCIFLIKGKVQQWRPHESVRDLAQVHQTVIHRLPQ